MSQEPTNSNPDITADDLRDRLVDRALAERLAGETPPDLTARILAAAEPSSLAKSHGDTSMDSQSSSRRSSARTWVLAASLLVNCGLMATLMIAWNKERQTAMNQQQNNLPAVQGVFDAQDPITNREFETAARLEASPVDGNELVSPPMVDIESNIDILQSMTATEGVRDARMEDIAGSAPAEGRVNLNAHGNGKQLTTDSYDITPNAGGVPDLQNRTSVGTPSPNNANKPVFSGVVPPAPADSTKFESFHQVELSAIPRPNEPPIVYPEAEVWEELTNRREKYKKADAGAQKGAGQESRMPSAYYLEDDAQYFSPTPEFRLAKEGSVVEPSDDPPAVGRYVGGAGQNQAAEHGEILDAFDPVHFGVEFSRGGDRSGESERPKKEGTHLGYAWQNSDTPPRDYDHTPMYSQLMDARDGGRWGFQALDQEARLLNRRIAEHSDVRKLDDEIQGAKAALRLALTDSKGRHSQAVKLLQKQLEDREAKLSALTVRLRAHWQGSPDGQGIGPDASGDKYDRIVENEFVPAIGSEAVSTFSIDVDTASYANVRQMLRNSQVPPADAVRLEEFVNYFDYDYEPPTADEARRVDPFGPKTAEPEAPFAAHVETAACPWQPAHRLVRIGIKGREVAPEKRPLSNLVFLVDVSGSMNEAEKLPLVVHGLKKLAEQLGENDRVAIVVYASSEGLVLPSTPGTEKETILAALNSLAAGGSTAGGAGIQLAYQIAEDNFIEGGTNRVILCTDGDFNVGTTSTAELERMVEQKAKETKVFLSCIGFGRGNLNDAMMEKITGIGNGNYYYADGEQESERIFVKGMTGMLVTIAKDVKIQVEFNPAKVAGYRLLGYENRMLATQDFNDDKKDAGEIGAGHTVTCLYEIVPVGEEVETAEIDELKYQRPAGLTDEADTDELLTLKMRYKKPDGDTSTKLEWPVADSGHKFGEASTDMQFAAAVASFGMLLRDSQYKGDTNYDAVIEIAESAKGKDPEGERAEFVELVRAAKKLKPVVTEEKEGAAAEETEAPLDRENAANKGAGFEFSND